MFYELGNFLGWLIIIAYVGTLLNYIIKFVNKKFGKKLSPNSTLKSILTLSLNIFVKNHRYFGFATFAFLLCHFLLQFRNFGFNISGAIAALILFTQVCLGFYGSHNKKPRKGTWFILHRLVALLLILGISLHLLFPQLLKTNDSNSKKSTSAEQTQTKTFTLEELSKYNGKDGQPAYVGYKGKVYDVSNSSAWKNGSHNGQNAGEDLTDQISKAPHGSSVFSSLPVVGTLK